jgi:putative integral membrane protein (TIGR02587 family)
MSPTADRPETPAADPDREFGVALARAFGGAIIFGLPLLMTMEMWTLGATMSPMRLALFALLWLPLLVGLSAVAGFERTLRLKHDALDAFVAIFVGVTAAVVFLTLLGVLQEAATARERVGMTVLQALPGSMGALLAVSQLGTSEEREEEQERRQDTWAGELLLMAVGALFLAFNIAPTEEITLLALKMTPTHSAVAILVSLGLMHAFVYAVEFSGQAAIPPGTPFASVFLRYTVVGYAIVLVICAYTLWTFGRLDGLAAAEVLSLMIALGLPGAVGAAAARLLL